MTTEQLIKDLRAIVHFLDHHPDALECGDCGEFTLMPLEALSSHLANAERGLGTLKAKVDAEIQEINDDVSSQRPHGAVNA